MFIKNDNIMKNLVETAIDKRNFKTFIRALRETDLIDILSYDGPFTIFAPTDQAFSKLPNGLMKKLLQDKEKLTELLTYHIVSNIVVFKELTNLKIIKTVNGREVKINSENGVKVEKTRVIKSNIECSNGVIHVINEVLIFH